MTGGNVTDQGSSAVTFRGVTFATHSNPMATSTPLPIIGNGTGSFTYELDGMDPTYTYYVRAYAINSTGITYGANVEYVVPGFADMGYPYETQSCVVWKSPGNSYTHDVIDNTSIYTGYLIVGWAAGYDSGTISFTSNTTANFNILSLNGSPMTFTKGHVNATYFYGIATGSDRVNFLQENVH